MENCKLDCAKELLGKLNNFFLVHVHREANKSVDFLANWGVSQIDQVLADSSTMCWLGLQEFIDQDISGFRADILCVASGP